MSDIFRDYVDTLPPLIDELDRASWRLMLAAVGLLAISLALLAARLLLR